MAGQKRMVFDFNEKVRITATSWRGQNGIIIDIMPKRGGVPWYEILLDDLTILTLSGYDIEPLGGAW